MRAKKVTHIQKDELEKSLKVKELFAIGYGDLGSSIYYALGITALFALGATPIALGLAGVVFICTALTYAELSSMYHEAGGSASFARHAFNDVVSFVAGWGLLLDYIVTIAISSFAVAPYLSVFFPSLNGAGLHIGFTCGLIAILFLVNYRGARESSRLSMALVSLTLVTQLIIIVLGFADFFDGASILDKIRIGVPGDPESPSWAGFWKGTAMAMVAYTGIESIAQLGSEAKNPSKNLPKAILLVMGVLFFVYLGISVVALSVIDPIALGTTYLNDPVAGIVEKFPKGGKALASWVGLLAGGILFAASNAGMIGASRLSYNMGYAYQLPGFFRKLHKVRNTPVVSLAFFSLIAAIIVIVSRGKMEFLADLYNFGAMLAFLSAHLSLIILRIKEPTKERPFRVPFNIPLGKYRIPITAIIGTFATAAVWVLVVITKPEGRYLGFAWIFLGLCMFYAYRKKKGLETGSIEIEEVDVPGYEEFGVSHVLIPTRGGENTQIVQMGCDLAKRHNAKVTALHIMQVPDQLPFDATLAAFVAEKKGQPLERAEAIGRELNVDIRTERKFARSIAEGILAVIEEEKDKPYDLLILGANHSRNHKLGAIVDQVVKNTNCRVIIYFNPN